MYATINDRLARERAREAEARARQALLVRAARRSSRAAKADRAARRASELVISAVGLRT